MTYLEFHFAFMLPALLVTGMAARGARRTLGTRVAWSIPLLAAIALAWTTPWDNHLVARGVWSYGPDRVLGTIGWVPVEEYLFFVLQPVLTSWLLCALLMRRPPTPSPPRNDLRIAGIVVWLGVACVGVIALRFPAGTYFGLILVWAAPVAAAQWAIGALTIRSRRAEAVSAVAVATVYLCIADGIAIRAGIWTISPATSTGVLVLGLPIEEAAFFLMTNILIVQGLLLFLGPEHEAVAS